MVFQADFTGRTQISNKENAAREFSLIFRFSPAILRESARKALREAMQTDDMHSQLSGAGSYFYHKFVEEARAEIDRLDEWTANRNDDNQSSPRAHRADGLTLAFAQGNPDTGYLNKTPESKNPLGNVTRVDIQQSVSTLDQQMTFVFPEEEPELNSHTFWLVLYRREDDTVKLEVSSPAGVTEDGKITGWHKRIILDDVTMSGSITEERTDERGEDGEVGVAISAR
ncbi:hypothetical protein QUW48_00930 [Bifidobacterium pullorum]|uniref:hypothetical protein n=1 Tax=Bifidobacterium pullorum TaxID=78448 RepID=UPI0025A33BEB|nr:hypothetical protein [Bifidobacterium pullorum]MDM8322130.1 hypothetical protein [Bifidobacterium pullorum]